MIQRIPPPSPQHHFDSCFPAFPTPSTCSSPGSWSLSSSLAALGPFSPPGAPRRPALRSALALCSRGSGATGLQELVRCGATARDPAPGRIPRGAGAGGCARPPGRTPARGGGGATMGCSSSALPKAGDSRRLRSGEQGFGSAGSPRGPKGATGAHPPGRGRAPRRGWEWNASAERLPLRASAAAEPGGGGPRAPSAPRCARPGLGAGVTPSPVCSGPSHP